MAKHKDGFLGIFSRLSAISRELYAVALIGAALGAVAPSLAQAADVACSGVSQAQADTVFNQAFATVSNLSDAAFRAKDRGEWRPDGSFRKRFFSQSGRALRTIKTLLTAPGAQASSCVIGTQVVQCISNSVPKAELLEAFESILSVPLPRGLRSLRRLQKIELENFRSTLETLPGSYVTCS